MGPKLLDTKMLAQIELNFKFDYFDSLNAHQRSTPMMTAVIIHQCQDIGPPEVNQCYFFSTLIAESGQNLKQLPQVIQVSISISGTGVP